MEKLQPDFKPKDSYKIYLWALLIPLIVSLIVSIIISFKAGGNAEESEKILNNVWVQIGYNLLYVVAMLGLFFMYPKKNNINLKTATGILNKTHYLNIIICICIGCCFVYLTAPIVEIYTYLLSLVGYQTPTDTSLPLDNIWWLLLAIFLSGVIPAVVEECIYRGMILNGLRKLGMWPSVLISAALFALMHLTLYQLLFTFALGIVLGLVVYKTRALWLSMIIHFCSNTVALVAMYIQTKNNVVASTSFDATYIIMAIVMALFAVALVWCAMILIDKINKRKQKTENANIEEQTVEVDKKLELLEKQQANKYLFIGLGLAVVLLIINSVSYMVDI